MLNMLYLFKYKKNRDKPGFLNELIIIRINIHHDQHQSCIEALEQIRTTLVREAIAAVNLAFAISSALASTIPRTFFWFGQIRTQTLKSIIVPIQAPKLIMAQLAPEKEKFE